MSIDRKLNILSIDGGGSRGVMEAMLLDDVMRLVTLVKSNPQPNLVDEFGDLGFREKLEKIEEKEVIHPTKIFDMIAGIKQHGFVDGFCSCCW